LLDGDLNYVRLADGQDALILVDTAYFAENFGLFDVLTNLKIIPADLPGDYNRDGAVGAAGYVLWREGSVVPGTVQNYALWRANFGKTADAGTSHAASAAVPEPGPCALSVAAIFAYLVRNQCLRRRLGTSP
jgi:hypothetical protein